MSDDEYVHMPWCPDLDHLNSCSLEQQVTDDLAICLTADQCEPGSVQLEVQGAARSAAELAALVAALEQFAAPVAIAESETSCVGHNHDEDEDEDDGPYPKTCGGCGATVEDWWHVGNGVGYLGISCGCLARAGYRESADGDSLERI